MAAICLDNRIGFCLLKKTHAVGFSFKNGWRDYFEPMFPEISVSKVSEKLLKSHRVYRIPVINKAVKQYLKSNTGCKYFGFDNIGRLPKSLNNKNLHMTSPDYWESMKCFYKILWQPNTDTQLYVKDYLTNLGLNNDYLAIHVRRGDKSIEHEYVPITLYLKLLNSLELELNKLYIATDDQRIVDEFRKALGNKYQIYTSFENQTGHDQSSFNNSAANIRKSKTLLFIAELEIIFNSTYFIGSQTSNVYFLSRYARGNSSMLCIEEN